MVNENCLLKQISPTFSSSSQTNVQEGSSLKQNDLNSLSFELNKATNNSASSHSFSTKLSQKSSTFDDSDDADSSKVQSDSQSEADDPGERKPNPRKRENSSESEDAN